MNVAFALSLVGSVIGLVVAALSVRFGVARGWQRHRLIALIASTASLFAMTDALSSIDISPTLLLAAIRFQGAVGSVHAACWIVYCQRHLGREFGRTQRALVGFLLALAPAWLVPGVMIGTHVTKFEVAWLGVTYANPETTVFGGASFALESLALLVPMSFYIRAKFAGVRDAGAHVAALASLTIAALHDTLVTLNVFRSPLLLSFGFLVASVVLGFALTRAFVDNAQELERLSERLERLVTERTDALVTAEANLFQSEKMAALGRIAAGVAHEINNPAAAIAANISYLRDGIGRGATPKDTLDCLDESLESVARIAKIVRQLLDAGRNAASDPEPDQSASLARAVHQALAEAKTHLTGKRTEVDVADDLYARGDSASLVQVLVNLVVNGAQAIPSSRTDGCVRLAARRNGSRIELLVEDNGTGMNEETKRRLFEPFFTTKPFGLGTGLGLPVSLGLIRSMGGNLHVESEPGRTVIRIVLVACAPSTSGPFRIGQSIAPTDEEKAAKGAPLATGRVG